LVELTASARTSSLAAIVALARAGAGELAWEMFERGGWRARAGDPSALVVEGRLLKDRAAAASGEDARRLYAASGHAYRAAAQLAPSSYALINAATLSLLGGEPEAATGLAGSVLVSLHELPDEPETPYYLHATRAEALLLLGREEDARTALADGIRSAPNAWEDQASTLRQFALILEAQGRDAGWLDAHRPPKSLHFGGHMSFRGEAEQGELKARIAGILAEEKVGFGYGALAAGADIIVAEALLEHGAELHPVLPGGAESFAALSVDPFGTEWRRRFDAVLAQAVEVRTVRPLGAAPDEAMIELADEVAMGAAVMNARRLESRPVQLLVVAGDSSQRVRQSWADAGWHQHLVTAGRDEQAAVPRSAATRRWSRLALLLVEPEQDDGVEESLARLAGAARLLALPSLPPHLTGGRMLIGFGSAREAAAAALALRDALPGLRIGGHYGAAETYRDPFSGGRRVSGNALAAAAGALASALPGTTYVTDDFAAALIASGVKAPRCERIGELDAPDGGPPVGLFVLKS
jgi:hypothetical protein